MLIQRIARQVIRNNNVKAISYFCSAKDNQKVHDFSTSHQTTQDQLSKDQQAQDDAFKFQREWEKLSKENEERTIQHLNEELSENQRKKVDLLAQAMLDLNTFESRYLSISIKQRILKTTNIDLMKLNADWPQIKQLENGTWPPNNPNWFLQQEAIAKLWPAGQEGMSQLFGSIFGGSVGASGGAPGGQQQAAAPAAAQEEEKKEEPVKQNFNLELAKFDAASKIKIIKEVRTILNLGLKEAKEMVEKAPCVLKQGLRKTEADELKEKLEKIGCTINLL